MSARGPHTQFPFTGLPGLADDDAVTRESALPRVVPGDAAPAALLLAERLERGERLGEGGMGVVWSCRDRLIGRRVALKVMKVREEVVANARTVTRFLREARVQGQLEHPAVVPVFDMNAGGEEGPEHEGGAPFFTMRRIRGVTLEAVIEVARSRPAGVAPGYSRRRMLGALSSVCLAVDYAHRKGVLHRDLKPSNIMLGQYGEVYVLDWGIAKVLSGRDEPAEVSVPVDLDELSDDELTQAAVGTIGYMSPEMLLGGAAADHRCTDVYSLGAMLYEILALSSMHPKGSPHRVALETCYGEVSLPSVRAPEQDIPPALDDICMRAIAREPGQRYQSARELHDAIEAHLDRERSGALRQELADRHTAAALELSQRAREDGAASLETRREAIREIGQALALNPSNPRAFDAMMQLLDDPPRDDPPEVEAATRQSVTEMYAWAGGAAGLLYISMLAFIPLFIWAGVRSVMLLIVFYGLALTSAALALFIRYSSNRSPALVLLAMVTSTMCYATSSAFYGPLMLTPVLMASNTAGYVMILVGWRKIAAIAFSLATFTILVALELAGILPSQYLFIDGKMIISPGAIGLAAAATYAVLTAVAVASVISISVAFGHMRDGLAMVQRRLHMANWQVRQLLPRPATRSAPADQPPGGSRSSAST